MFRFKNPVIQLLLVAFIAATLVHGSEQWSYQLSSGVHETADDASYLCPAENFLHTGNWKDNSEGAAAFVQRPPLMGIIHLLALFISSHHSGWVLFGFALLLHLYACTRLYFVLKPETTDSFAFWGTAAYSVFPCYWGFLSYQITEAFSSSVVLIGIAIFLLPHRYKWGQIMLFLTALYLFRPLLLLLFIPLLLRELWLLQKNRTSNYSRKSLLVLTVCLITVGFWEVRKHHYTGEWGNPHPIYHETNASVFRPVHQELSGLFRLWETRPEVFHALVGACWSSDSLNPQLINDYCSERAVPISPDRLFLLLNHYQEANREVSRMLLTGQQLRNTLREQQLIREIQFLHQSTGSRHVFQNWIKTPFTGLSEQLPKSQLNLGIFQEKYRGNPFVELLRWLCVCILNVSLMATLIGLLIKNKSIQLVASGIILYLIYLFWFQRMNEDRYLIPAYTMAFTVLIVLIFQFTHRKKSLHNDEFRSSVELM